MMWIIEILEIILLWKFYQNFGNYLFGDWLILFLPHWKLMKYAHSVLRMLLWTILNVIEGSKTDIILLFPVGVSMC
jgi:hypothetical protein